MSDKATELPGLTIPRSLGLQITQAIFLSGLLVHCGGSETNGPASCVISGLAISLHQLSLEAGYPVSGRLVATVSQSNCRPVSTATWSSSDSTLVQVDTAISGNTAYITGLAPGGPVRVIAAADRFRDTALVTVVPARVKSVSVSPAALPLRPLASIQLSATPKDTVGTTLNGRTITWQSSDPTRLTVTPKGLISGVSPGAVTVTATADGVDGSATVLVVPQDTLVFVSVVQGERVFQIETDGTGLKDLTGNQTSSSLQAPAWAPDGSVVYFVGYQGGRFGIFPVDGAAVVGAEVPWSPSALGTSLSPAGDLVAFSDTLACNVSACIFDVFVTPANASGTRIRVSFAAPTYVTPGIHWSPDGSRIAFCAGSGVTQLYVANADGSGAVKLTSDPSGKYGCGWWPDGSRLIFSSQSTNTGSQIVTINADGSGRVALTSPLPGVFDHGPSVSPDGKRVAFIRSCGPPATSCPFGIWLMQADGTGQVPMYSPAVGAPGPWFIFSPAWRP